MYTLCRVLYDHYVLYDYLTARDLCAADSAFGVGARDRHSGRAAIPQLGARLAVIGKAAPSTSHTFRLFSL